MDAVHIKNLDLYNPGYKDRSLIWCKVYFSMINADPGFELLCEIDKWRFIALVMLELQLKKPVPLNEKYLERKGFDLDNRPMSLTLKMLHNLIECVTEDSNVCYAHVTQSRVEKSRIEEKRGEKKRKDRLFPIPGKVCQEKHCQLPAVYKTNGEYSHYYCQEHMPESVKARYE